jgi:hypothetical protein
LHGSERDSSSSSSSSSSSNSETTTTSFTSVKKPIEAKKRKVDCNSDSSNSSSNSGFILPPGWRLETKGPYADGRIHNEWFNPQNKKFRSVVEIRRFLDQDVKLRQRSSSSTSIQERPKSKRRDKFEKKGWILDQDDTNNYEQNFPGLGIRIYRRFSKRLSSLQKNYLYVIGFGTTKVKEYKSAQNLCNAANLLIGKKNKKRRRRT